MALFHAVNFENPIPNLPMERITGCPLRQISSRTSSSLFSCRTLLRLSLSSIAPSLSSSLTISSSDVEGDKTNCSLQDYRKISSFIGYSPSILFFLSLSLSLSRSVFSETSSGVRIFCCFLSGGNSLCYGN